MGSTRINLEMLLPDPTLATGTRVPLVPFLSIIPPRDWEFNQGVVLFSINDVDLLDGSFTLYPWNQMQAVLSITEFAAARRAGTEIVGGSIIRLITTPIDAHHATFGMDVPARGANEARHAAVAANINDVVAAVTSAARQWLEHVPRKPPPRPLSAPGPGEQEQHIREELSRIEALARTMSAGHRRANR
jgi:hypothetical protein